MLAFEHNAGGYGTPGTLASDAETSGEAQTQQRAICTNIAAPSGETLALIRAALGRKMLEGIPRTTID
jgi:hypothetical protein